MCLFGENCLLSPISVVLQRKVGQISVREQLNCEQDAVQPHPKLDEKLQPCAVMLVSTIIV